MNNFNHNLIIRKFLKPLYFHHTRRLKSFTTYVTFTKPRYYHNMSQTHNSLVKPPECVRGMTVLDKSKFDSRITLPILDIKDVKVSNIMPHIKKYCFKMRRLKPLQIFDNGRNYILLNPEIVTRWTDIAIAIRTKLEEHSITELNLTSTEFTIKYENYNADEIFKAILPSEQEGFSSFSQIGHIVHINLREHLYSYKDLIAQVLLDMVSNARTIVNKVDAIDNTYRNFKMELLCGEDNTMVEVKENRCVFNFDFAKVYWNTRLSTEHERIVKLISPGDVLFDVFAGVGPFSVPASKKKIITFANDLNPESYKWLNHNFSKNKVDPIYFETFNKDGRNFILTELKYNLKRYIKTSKVHVVMNLPALGVEFLDSFYKLYDQNEIDEDIIVPTVYVYCFTKGENSIEIAKRLVNENTKYDIADKIVDIFKVRTVSSFKDMMRVTFKLERDILVGLDNKRKCIEENTATNSAKKCCHGEKEKQCIEEHDETKGSETETI